MVDHCPVGADGPHGVAHADLRKSLNHVSWRLRLGSLLAGAPERHVPATNCNNRIVRRRKLGVWIRIFDALSWAYRRDLPMSIVSPFACVNMAPTACSSR